MPTPCHIQLAHALGLSATSLSPAGMRREVLARLTEVAVLLNQVCGCACWLDDPESE